MKGWKKLFHAHGNQKKAGVEILVSDKIDFKIKTVTRDKEGLIQQHIKGSYTMIKWDLSQGCRNSSIYANQSM